MRDEPVEVVEVVRRADGLLAAQLRLPRQPDVEHRVVVDASGGLLEWHARAASGVLSARGLREVPIGALVRAVLAGSARRQYAAPTLSAVDGDAPASVRWRAWAADFALRPHPGAGGRDDRPYAALAACYVEALQAGERRPVGIVARDLGYREQTVRNHLTTARERGLLTAAVAGRPGGELTAKARQLLGLDPGG